MSGQQATLAAEALGNLADIKARHPEIFKANLKRRARVLGVVGIIVGLALYGFITLDFTFARFFNGIGQLFWILRFMLPPSWGNTERLFLYLNAMGETLAIAFLGTLFAALLAFPFSLLAARNTTFSGIVRFLTRRVSDTVRGVDALIWALIWVGVVGLGPFAGTLAIMSSDFGSFIKLFSEAIEAADDKPVEGIVSSGGAKLHATRFGTLPQVLPVIAGQILYYFESNTRSSTIIGIVGAGGIGLHLTEEIRTLEWQHVSFLILLILVAVAVIGWISAKLRFAIMGRQAERA